MLLRICLRHHAYFLLAVCSVLFILPGLFIPFGHDQLWHFLWSKHLSAALASGALFPKWLPDLFNGCGSPVLFFYPPIAFYLASLFNGLASSDSLEWFALLPVWFLLHFGGGCLMYRFLRCYLRQDDHSFQRIPLIGALAYQLLPIGMYMFSYGYNYAFFMTFLWLPLGLLLIEAWSAQPRRLISLFGLLCAAQVMSSVSGAILVIPLWCLYLCYRADSLKQALVQIAFSGLLAFGLAAIYLLPMLYYLPHTNALEVRLFDSLNHSATLLSWSKLSTDVPFFTSVTYIFEVLTWIGLAFLYIKLRTVPETGWRFWFILAIIASMLKWEWTSPIWEYSYLLPHLQFPYRLSFITYSAIAVLVAYLLRHYAIRLGNLICLGITFLSLHYFFALMNYQPITQTLMRSMLYHANTVYMSTYMPKYVGYDQQLMWDYLLENPYLCHHPIHTEGDILAAEQHGNRHSFHLRNASDHEITATIGQYYFPTWKLKRDGEHWDISPNGEGLVRFTLPPGEHHFTLTMPPSRVERISFLFSGLSLLLCLWLYGSARLRRTK